MIRYRKLRHWKFILHEDYLVDTGITGFEFPRGDDSTKLFLIELTPAGQLTVRKGYCWDGPSGPVPAWISSLRPALVHDALYQMLRLGALPQDLRDEVDNLFHRHCLESGMKPWLARCFWWAVRQFGRSAASEPEPYPTVHIAP